MEIRTIGPFLHYFGNVRERTMRVARCIPPDKIDWTYAPAKFTLGDLLRHLAVAERIHHRGQVYIYLSLLGVATPPLYGLTSEQVRSRAAVD